MRAALTILSSFFLLSCVTELDPVVMPEIDWATLEQKTIQLSAQGRAKMDGVYVVDQGSDLFGDTVVMRWEQDRFTLLARVDVVFAVVAGGLDGERCLFEGYYRVVRSNGVGRVQLNIEHDEGTAWILSKPGVQSDIKIRGTYGASGNEDVVVLRRVRPLADLGNYLVIAHRGGGRNSERLGCSENSKEMIGLSPFLGANAIEIDVKRTRDNEIIVFHDETFSPRTIRGAYILGEVSRYSLHDVRRYARLIYGEQISTLDEVLRYVIDSTTIRFVWLDVKDGVATDLIIAAQDRALNYARSTGRNIEIVFGIPTQEILDAYRGSTLRDRTPVLCELTLDDVESLPTCTFWAPRWTNGIPSSNIRQLQSKSVTVVTWTIDMASYMQQFVNDGTFDGILTNYPCLLAAYAYSNPR